MQKKMWLLILAMVFLLGCTAFEMKGRDGNTYRYEWCPECWTEAWQEVADDIRAAQDECLQGKRMDCWGDPAGGGAGGGGGGADAGAGGGE